MGRNSAKRTDGPLPCGQAPISTLRIFVGKAERLSQLLIGLRLSLEVARLMGRRLFRCPVVALEGSQFAPPINFAAAV